MTNTLELEIAMKRAGLTKRKLAKEMRLSEVGLYNKFRNKSEFKASEIKKIAEVLNLSMEETNNIFLC